MTSEKSVPKAVIFDLDGVITFTSRLHAAVWKESFDDYLQKRSKQLGEQFRPFDAEWDYRRYVDGRPRRDGIRSFLGSRNIRIPDGSPSDSASTATIWGLGNHKNELFKQRLQQVGVEVDYDAIRLVRELRSCGVRTGLASSSKNARSVLDRAKLGSLFDAVVDGLVSERLHLRGKPGPDIFLQCLAWLNSSANPRDAAIVEDAISGVEAGKRGGFGLVLGVDRHNSGDLKVHGADWVIRSFSQITATQFTAYFALRMRAA
jgi:HAD superfamily hydrolase (TIGR01509 family)